MSLSTWEHDAMACRYISNRLTLHNAAGNSISTTYAHTVCRISSQLGSAEENLAIQ